MHLYVGFVMRVRSLTRSHFDVAMVPTAMPSQEFVMKETRTHCTLWTTLEVDILHHTRASQSQQC